MIKEGLKKEEVKMLPIMEDFYTIQGEGFHSGLPSYFIRIGGCDVGCHWCDVKESWDASIHPLKPVDDLVLRAEKYSKNIIITGGEPLMWDLNYLVKKFKQKHCKMHIETSGAYSLTGNWDWICLSPKKRSLPLAEVYEKAHELKVIVYNKDDFKFAEEQAEQVNSNCILYLQPEWSKSEEVIPLIVNYILKNPKWKVSLQTHKYMHIP